MSQFREHVKVYFSFLSQFGYFFSEESDSNAISFVGKNNVIYITFSTISYEVTCEFVDGDNKAFSLQDGLKYEYINKYSGMYQVSNRNELEKGIGYLAEAVKILFEKIDISDPLNFQKIYQFRVDTHKELLQQYYLETDLKKAENYWKKKEYEKAKELFEKNIDHLSNSQLKKLEIIRNGTM